jgi:hypothetical protein
MVLEKLANLERMLGNSYNEGLRIRLTKDSPHYQEIAEMVGDRKNSTEIKRLLNLT